MFDVHIKERIKRVFKYLVHWMALLLALQFVPGETRQLEWSEILIISTIGSIVFAVLDIYSPSISDSAVTMAEESKVNTLQV